MSKECKNVGKNVGEFFDRTRLTKECAAVKALEEPTATFFGCQAKFLPKSE